MLWLKAVREGQVLIVCIPNTYQYAATLYPVAHILAELSLETTVELLLRTLFLKVKAVNYMFSIQVIGKYTCSFFSAVHKNSGFDVFVSVGKGSETQVILAEFPLYLLFSEHWVSEFPVVLDLHFSQHF